VTPLEGEHETARIHRNDCWCGRICGLETVALTNRLPSMFHNEEFVKAGGLLSYGANVPEIFRRSAVYADKIIKGAKPIDLPVEQPTLFRMFANLQTAKSLGLTIQPTALILADQVIE